MFSGCENIKYINFSNFSTSNVNDMSWMFSWCNSLNSLPDISKWDTSNVNDMSGMFNRCKPSLNIPKKFKK